MNMKMMMAILLFGVLGLGCTNPIASPTGSRTSAAPLVDRQFTIIDAHAHLGGSFNWDTIVAAMNRNGVSKQVVMARYYEGLSILGADEPGSDELALKLAEAHPGRFYPLIGMQRPILTGPRKWNKPDRDMESLIQGTERKLQSGKFFGVGEFIVRHWSYAPKPGPHDEQDNPIYSELMRRFSALAARFDVPIVIHMEGYPKLVADFSRLLSEYPATRYVWAHNCGRSKGFVISELLSRFPNLFCDLGGMTNPPGYRHYGSGWPRMEEFTSLIERDGVLLPEMRALYEKFPDRFMVGTDLAHAPYMKIANYSAHVGRFRELLGQLNPETRAKIAELNAIRIFKLAR